MARRPVKVFINKRVAKGITREVARAGIEYAALQAENELVDILSVPPRRTGRIYPRGRNGTHQASSEIGGELGGGEAPAPDTGELRQSVKSYPEEFGDSFRAIVGTPLERGALLQQGTENIKPRPWISLLATEERWSRILKAFRVGVRRQYSRARRSFSE